MCYKSFAYFEKYLSQILQFLIGEGDGWHDDAFDVLLVYLAGFHYFCGQLISTLFYYPASFKVWGESAVATVNSKMIRYLFTDVIVMLS